MIEGNPLPFGLGVSGIASKHTDGTSIPKRQVSTPYQLIFKAPDTVKGRFSNEKPDTTWYDEIKSNISQGEVIYEVYAYRPSTSQAEESEIKIADVRLLTPLHTSLWADEHLYFKHKRIQRDRKYWPLDLKRL